jgi:EVE domain
MRYWINTICRDHVTKGVQGGFTQAGHGSLTGLAKLSEGDMMIFYSPRTALPRTAPALQQFTAVGRVTDSSPYQVTVSESFKPLRRKMEFTGDVKSVDVRPLIEDLEFIQNKRYWGMAFRRGLFPISEKDFDLISKAMTGK